MMRRGQAMIEYVIATASLVVVTLILWGFLKVVIRYAERTENVVASEYP